MSRREKIQLGAAKAVAFYRKNPHLFARDYLHIKLRLFQQILLVAMNMCDTTVVSACRGLGKTYLSAVYLSIRAILYPDSKIVIASKTRSQAYTVIEKIILELKPNSPELAAEIDDKATKLGSTNGLIVFKNGLTCNRWPTCIGICSIKLAELLGRP